ncbi:hypothetical protein [Methanoregula sp.]|uniref:hypothetical protein n=1 Tax=Methanoregula sp. TaxID=2052170 RepID=UPI003569A367
MKKNIKIPGYLKRIYAHLLSLDVDGFLQSRPFKIFCLENDIEDLWIRSFNDVFEHEDHQDYDSNNFPLSWTDEIFGGFLTQIYIDKEGKFGKIVAAFLKYYSKFSSIPINIELIKDIGFDLLDLECDEEWLYIDFENAGYDLPSILQTKPPSLVPGKEKNAISVEEHSIQNISKVHIPHEIQESLKKFKLDHPDPKKVAFIMMQFGNTQDHTNILSALRKSLAESGLKGLRADDKAYHSDTYFNILTYLHGCGFGIAVFEIISQESFNPNVSLEVGYLLGLDKPICLLKEENLETLPSDLVGKLYREFTIKNCNISVGNSVKKWLNDWGLCVHLTPLESYLLNSGFRDLKIDRKMDPGYAIKLAYKNIQVLNSDFLEEMKKIGFLSPTNSLSEFGKLFIRNTLGKYLE